MEKCRIAVLFGGRSPEHWISFKSAQFVMLFLDRQRYEVEAVYVDPAGQFCSGEQYLQVMSEFFDRNRVTLFLDSDGLDDWRGLLQSCASQYSARFLETAAAGRWDLLLPVFHGRHGEDGTFQGLAARLGIPCAGCNMQGSVIGMDKILTKQVASAAGLAVAPWDAVDRANWQDHFSQTARRLTDKLGLPLFIKPSRLGSSIGVNRATTIDELHAALAIAFEYDHRVLVESEIRGTEYAVGILGRLGDTRASVIAEYTSQPENFDYDSKYGPQSLPDIIPAKLNATDTRRMISFAKAVFASLKMTGISRVDSFWGPDGPVLNEVNTMPGLNPGSPFILAWEKAGVSKRQLLTDIVELARTTR